jgi:hypothetical protein
MEKELQACLLQMQDMQQETKHVAAVSAQSSNKYFCVTDQRQQARIRLEKRLKAIRRNKEDTHLSYDSAIVDAAQSVVEQLKISLDALALDRACGTEWE